MLIHLATLKPKTIVLKENKMKWELLMTCHIQLMKVVASILLMTNSQNVTITILQILIWEQVAPVPNLLALVEENLHKLTTLLTMRICKKVWTNLLKPKRGKLFKKLFRKNKKPRELNKNEKRGKHKSLRSSQNKKIKLKRKLKLSKKKKLLRRKLKNKKLRNKRMRFSCQHLMSKWKI